MCRPPLAPDRVGSAGRRGGAGRLVGAIVGLGLGWLALAGLSGGLLPASARGHLVTRARPAARHRAPARPTPAEDADADAAPAPSRPSPRPANGEPGTRAGSPGAADPRGQEETGRTPGPAGPAAAVASLSSDQLSDFAQQPAVVRKLLGDALELTRRNLTYTYGSADPANGGLDCSGAIYYLLRTAGFPDVPRQANEQYAWVRRRAAFYAVVSRRPDTFELAELRPGDLLFWTGTYQVDRDPPVTHTMIFLGHRKADGKPVMVGASDGRTYDGQRRNGFSVFDFHLPSPERLTARVDPANPGSPPVPPDRTPTFVGYGPVPGLAEVVDYETRRAQAASAARRSEEGRGEVGASPATSSPSRSPRPTGAVSSRPATAAADDDAAPTPSPGRRRGRSRRRSGGG